MNTDEELSSTILSNVEIIADIYNLVKIAGERATSNKNVNRKTTNVCAIIPNKPGVNRTSDCMKDNTARSITYNANDIMIVGGAALNIYDYKLKEYKTKRSLGALEEYIKKKTSDIDIVWWPRETSRDAIITSKSPAILALKNEFQIQIDNIFAENLEKIEAQISPYIPGITNMDKLKIISVSKGTLLAGVFNINIIFSIKGYTLKMCDVIIHDGGSSQRYDKDGKEITDLRFMSYDPLYCYPNMMNTSSVIYFQKNTMINVNINNINILVPNVISFVEQQMLAFDNFIREQNVKSLINYKRIEFVKKLLISGKTNNMNNRKNYKSIFKTNSKEQIDNIEGKIDYRVNESINKYYLKIIQICNKINKSSDEIVNTLCNKANEIKDKEESSTEQFNKFIKLQTEGLEDVKTSIWDKYKRTQSSEIKHQYKQLYENAHNYKIMLLRLKPEDIDTIKENQIEIIKKEEERIDKLAIISKKNKYVATKPVSRMQRQAPLLSHPQTYMQPQQQYLQHPSSYVTPQQQYIPYQQQYMQPQYTHQPAHIPYGTQQSYQSVPYQIPIYHQRPIQVYQNSYGHYTYIDPLTGKLVIWDQVAQRWTFAISQSQSTGMRRRGGINSTRKNKKRNNYTLKQ
jgi:hypothetical protein